MLQFLQLGRQFPIEARIAGLSSRVVECDLITAISLKDAQAATELRDTIESYFKVELGAIHMMRVNPAMVKSVPDGTPHWFYGDNNCSLYFVVSEGKIVRFSVSIFGNYIEGGEGKPMRYGQVTGDEAREAYQYKGASEVKWADRIPSDFTETISKFLFNISKLEPTFRFSISDMVGKAIAAQG
jgi:hypothetical protein